MSWFHFIWSNSSLNTSICAVINVKKFCCFAKRSITLVFNHFQINFKRTHQNKKLHLALKFKLVFLILWFMWKKNQLCENKEWSLKMKKRLDWVIIITTTDDNMCSPQLSVKKIPNTFYTSIIYSSVKSQYGRTQNSKGYWEKTLLHACISDKPMLLLRLIGQLHS